MTIEYGTARKRDLLARAGGVVFQLDGRVGPVGVIDVDVETDNLNVSDQTISDIK